MPENADTVSREEILFRRIPVIWVQRDSNLPPVDLAFKPREDDTNGISLDRAKLKTIQQAAQPPRASDKKYFVGKLRAGDLLDDGMDLGVDPTDGHALILNLTYEKRDEKIQKGWRVKMAHELCVVVDPTDEAVIFKGPGVTWE